eukprot:TRINITY_DN43981_c0_g1_i1.p1 TRINITY_DN43981_c0_g1~~TRINITY_DN43981_c0_g1_i1.p1  ORF type:complete len:558 (-),score=99.47 TRINITY_DN43981_c0_g1_i1:69-1742(-)
MGLFGDWSVSWVKQIAGESINFWHNLRNGELGCGLDGEKGEAFSAFKTLGVPGSCFSAGFTRVACCSDVFRHATCYANSEFDGLTHETCCQERDACIDAFRNAISRDAFATCESFFDCAVSLFIPCLLWNLEEDRLFDDVFAKDLLMDGVARCYSIELHKHPEVEGDAPAKGRDFWNFGLCVPRSCSKTELMPRLTRVFDNVQFATVPGGRLPDIRGSHTVIVDELMHWAQLSLDFALVGPPNSGTTTLHHTLMEQPWIRFANGKHEADLPTSKLRFKEAWSWLCTSPALIKRAWAERLGLDRRSLHDLRVRRLVGLRNPKIVYSPTCLQRFLAVPGIRLIFSWRDPVDWLWSSLSRSVEGFEGASGKAATFWAELQNEEKEPFAITSRKTTKLKERGGGLHELSMWRLGVPLRTMYARVASKIRIAADAIGSGRCLIVDFAALRSTNESLAVAELAATLGFLGAIQTPINNLRNSSRGAALFRSPASLQWKTGNMRRRQASLTSQQHCTDGTASAFRVKFLDEYKAMALLLASYGAQPRPRLDIASGETGQCLLRS